MKRFILSSRTNLIKNILPNNNSFNSTIKQVNIINSLNNNSNTTSSNIKSFYSTSTTPSTTHNNKQLFNDEKFYHEDKYHGISKEPFSKDIVDVLLAELDPNDIEIKPDGLIYLPEIKYRRILNQAFGPGGWALKPFGPPTVENKSLIRPYALYCLGRYVAESIGEQAYNESNQFISFATATESAKSNALVRCCKDLGIGSSLWDPIFIRQWKSQNATEKWFENTKTKERRLFWVLSNGLSNQIPYPWKESDYSQVPQQTTTQPTQQYQQQHTTSTSTIQQPAQETITYHQDDSNTNASSSSSSSSSATTVEDVEQDIDIDDVVPPQLKKYAGKTWRQLVADPKGVSYLQWAAGQFDSYPKIKNQAQAILEFINKGDLNQ